MRRGKILKCGLGLLLVATVAFAIWRWPHWRAWGEAGSAYAARITCSCRYVEGRDPESCAREIKEDAALVSVTSVPEEKAIVGTVPLLGKAKAIYKAGYGCLMQPTQK
jgi:hypothetical protein